MLTSQGLAPDDDNTWNLLISKHPQGECPSNLPIPSTETVLPPDFNIVPVLRSFSKLTGAGPTVSEIVLEPGCANLLYHAWYLDDGVVAGSSTEIEEVGALDPQVALMLLRTCSSFCKLSHLARATPPSLSVKALELFDQDVRSCLSQSTSVDLTDVSWNQAQLSLSRGGLGMRSLMLHAPAAYIASVCSSGYGLQSLTHLTHAVEMFNVCVAPADKISLDSLASSNINQKMLSSKLDDYQLQGIFNRSSVADRARLLSISAPHSSSWLSVVPSEGLGLHFEPNQYNVALKWWLGLDTSCGSSCVFCPDSILDPLGHHASTCKRGGDAVYRHNLLRDVFADSCRLAHLPVKLEGNNLTPDHDHSRPADVLVHNWSLGKPAAFDFCVTSPLNSLILSKAGVSSGVAVQASEIRKHNSNDAKCVELGWVCIPLVVETNIKKRQSLYWEGTYSAPSYFMMSYNPPTPLHIPKV
eukprot:Em0003g340a